MKRDYKLYLNDIKESIELIEIYLKNINEVDFIKDNKLQDAVIRRFEIIGEASRNIPRALKDKNENIPWFKMSEFRNLISHAYFEVSLKRIWNNAKVLLPEIKDSLKNIKLI